MRTPQAPKIDAEVPFEAPVEMLTRRASIGTKRTPELEVAFGARIRTARIAAKMSQGDLGAAVGISFQQVQKYENGKDRVAASTLQGFAEALGVHPGSFFGDEMPAPSGNIPEVRAAMRIAVAVQRIRDPAVVRRLLALVDLLAEVDGATAERSTVIGDEAP